MSEDFMNGWEDIKRGEVWQNKKTKKQVLITETPKHRHSGIRLYHVASRRTTTQQLHYFMYDFELFNGKNSECN